VIYYDCIFIDNESYPVDELYTMDELNPVNMRNMGVNPQ